MGEYVGFMASHLFLATDFNLNWPLKKIFFFFLAQTQG